MEGGSLCLLVAEGHLLLIIINIKDLYFNESIRNFKYLAD